MVDDGGEMLQHDLEEAVLRLLQTGDTKIGSPASGLVRRYGEDLTLPLKPGRNRIAESLWELLRRGLVYVHFGDNPRVHDVKPGDWAFVLTARGEAAIANGPVSPDMPGSFLEAFVRDLPQASDAVRLYVREALVTYHQQNFLASTVMMGVAAEAAFFNLAESLCKWLPSKEGQSFRKALNNRQTPYSALLRDFRAAIDRHKSDIPPDLLDGIGIQLVAVLDLIRNYRNDAGHPTGKTIDRATCHVCLTNFKVAMDRLYAIKAFFEGDAP